MQRPTWPSPSSANEFQSWTSPRRRTTPINRRGRHRRSVPSRASISKARPRTCLCHRQSSRRSRASRRGRKSACPRPVETGMQCNLTDSQTKTVTMMVCLTGRGIHISSSSNNNSSSSIRSIPRHAPISAETLAGRWPPGRLLHSISCKQRSAAWSVLGERTLS